MSTMAMAESFDAQMMDFSGEDIPMQTSSSASWVHPEATMDDDSNFNLGDVEIDMENYHPETFEYEMTDDSSTDQPIEVHDVEVVDVSEVHTPALVDTVVEDAISASPGVPEHVLTDTRVRSPLNTPPTLVIQAPLPTPQPTQDKGSEIAVTEPLGQSEWEQGHSELPSVHPLSHLPEHHQPQSPTEPTNPEGVTEPTPTWSASAPVEQQPTPTPLEQIQPQFADEEPAEDSAHRWGEEENPTPSRASSGDPHEVLDGIFIDPPPPVLLSLGGSKEEYHLFNRPTHKSPTADNEAPADNSLFLHDLPTLYYEPLAKVFEALRSDTRLTQLFDLSRGELVIDAYDLVGLVISEDNLYANEVSFHDLNLLHDHADLAGPLRIRVGCNLLRFVTRYRELKSKLEQFNLLDEVSVDHGQFREQDDLTEQPDANDGPEYPAQDEEGDENPTPEVFDQATIEQRTDGAGSDIHTANRFDEGESSNETGPGQTQPAGDEESNAGPLSSDEHTEQPVGAIEDGHKQGATVMTVSDRGRPGTTEDPDVTTVHERSEVRNTSPAGGTSSEYDEVVAANEEYEADYNEHNPDSEPGEAVTIECDARDGDWETNASDTRQTQGDLEQYEVRYDAVGADKHFDAIDLTTPRPDDDPVSAQQDADTDSIGQQTSDELADAQEKPRDDHLSREGEESNSNTDQSNELAPDFDQFGDDFNWDEDFGGDFEDGEFGEFEDQSNVETKTVDHQEPVSGRTSKRGFDEIDSDTVDEEQTLGDVSPNSKRKKVL